MLSGSEIVLHKGRGIWKYLLLLYIWQFIHFFFFFSTWFILHTSFIFTHNSFPNQISTCDSFCTWFIYLHVIRFTLWFTYFYMVFNHFHTFIYASIFIGLFSDDSFRFIWFVSFLRDSFCTIQFFCIQFVHSLLPILFTHDSFIFTWDSFCIFFNCHLFILRWHTWFFFFNYFNIWFFLHGIFSPPHDSFFLIHSCSNDSFFFLHMISVFLPFF